MIVDRGIGDSRQEDGGSNSKFHAKCRFFGLSETHFYLSLFMKAQFRKFFGKSRR
jgi:hypothetical protein